MERETFKVSGMHCSSCVALVKDSLEEAGGKDVRIKLVKGGDSEVSLSNPSNLAKEKLRGIIEAEGYKVK